MSSCLGPGRNYVWGRCRGDLSANAFYTDLDKAKLNLVLFQREPNSAVGATACYFECVLERTESRLAVAAKDLLPKAQRVQLRAWKLTRHAGLAVLSMGSMLDQT